MAMASISAGMEEAKGLVTHTVAVLKGEMAAMDPASAVPTGLQVDLVKELACLGCFSLVVLVLCRVLQVTLFPALGKLVGVSNPVKWSESCREMSFYSASLSLSWLVWGSESWMYNVDEMWKFDRQFTVPKDFKTLYVFECSWYVAGLFALVVLDTRRKDFLPMLLHHVVTILLLTLSFAASHMRVGAVVIVLHNVSDPFLQFAKLCKYAKLETGSTLLFVCFMLTFLLSRLVYYPYVIYSCHFRGPGYFFNREHDFVENSLTGLLTALFPIHVFWFWCIIKVAIKALRGNINDSRSDSDEDEAAPAKKTQ